jgi:hypothetical protein
MRMFLDLSDVLGHKFGASVTEFGLKFLMDDEETFGLLIGGGNGAVRCGCWLGVRTVTDQSVRGDVEMFARVVEMPETTLRGVPYRRKTS